MRNRIFMKKKIIFFLLCFSLFFNGGCLNEDNNYSAAKSASFTNLTDETVLLYIDGTLNTQIFSQTTYLIEIPEGHHTYEVLDKNTREELKSGSFSPGDKINIMPKT